MTQKLKTVLCLAAFALLIVVVALGYNALAGRTEPPQIAFPEEAAGPAEETGAVRQRAPDFAFVDRNGNGMRFSDITAGGKPVVLNFWASWCPSCRNETPGFERVYRDRGDEVKFVMLGLADGVRETVETGMRYIEDGGFTLPVYFDTLREGAIAYGIRFIPTTVLIDAEGYVITAMQGAVNEARLRSAIDAMLSPR